MRSLRVGRLRRDSAWRRPPSGGAYSHRSMYMSPRLILRVPHVCGIPFAWVFFPQRKGHDKNWTKSWFLEFKIFRFSKLRTYWSLETSFIDHDSMNLRVSIAKTTILRQYHVFGRKKFVKYDAKIMCDKFVTMSRLRLTSWYLNCLKTVQKALNSVFLCCSGKLSWKNWILKILVPGC